MAHMWKAANYYGRAGGDEQVGRLASHQHARFVERYRVA